MTCQVSQTPKTALERERKARGLTREQLAVAAGISSRTVSRIERREHVPYRATLAVIAHALGVSVTVIDPANDERPVSPPDARKSPQGGADRGAG